LGVKHNARLTTQPIRQTQTQNAESQEVKHYEIATSFHYMTRSSIGERLAGISSRKKYIKGGEYNETHVN
jgi:hypothetical protein